MYVVITQRTALCTAVPCWLGWLLSGVRLLVSCGETAAHSVTSKFKHTCLKVRLVRYGCMACNSLPCVSSVAFSDRALTILELF